jgi:hypothetical protein
MELVEILERNGFRRVPLTRSAVGHFRAAGKLNDRPVTVLVDTGASSTVLSLPLARELGLDLLESPQKGGGAGGAELEVYRVPGATLFLEGVAPRSSDLVAMDLSHANQALAAYGDEPVEVILGVDVFDAQSAVIDYGSNSLFLKN